MEEWKEYKLGDVVNVLDYKRVPLSSKERSLHQGIYPYYGAQGIIDYVDDYIFDGTYLLIAEDGENLKSKKQNIAQLATGKYWVNNHAHIAESNGKCDIRFICYLLNIMDVSGYITGSAQPKLNQANLLSISIKLPSLQIQKNIANFLSAFDNKIECNHRINDNFAFSFLLLTCFVLWLLKLRNDNLEKQAQALFKSWFVDFEPFKDGEFVESEMGMIPKGWRVGVYDDIILETISGDWGKEKAEGNYTHKVACIRGCDFQDIKNGLRGKTLERFIMEKNYQNKHFCDKDMLVEISGGTATVSTGRVCPISQQLINKYNGDVVCTNFCRLVRPKKGYGAYLYYSWFNKYNNKVMFGYENGTSGIKNFRIKDFTSIEPVVLPPIEKIQEFQNVIDSIQKQIQTRGTESQNLAQLRDTLLPRLMSGELKVEAGF